MRLLAKHVRKHAGAAGHASLAKLGRGTVSKILSANQDLRALKMFTQVSEEKLQCTQHFAASMRMKRASSQ